MCKIFEEMTGKKNEGNVGELKGLLKSAVDARLNATIIKVPVELFDIDENYQIPERTARSLNYLVNHWDDNKLLPLAGVPHFEEGKIYLFDGFGRWIGSQLIQNPNPESREKIEKVLIKYLRKIEPIFLKSESVVAYPMVDYKIACSLFTEDIVVRELNAKHKRKVENGKVTFVLQPNDLKEEGKIKQKSK